MSSEPALRFDAFISYRRSDGAKVAHWLRRALEGFQVPKALRPAFGRKLSVYLDTAYERGTTDFYEQSIKPALMSSRFLLVLATPDARLREAGAQDWIAREVADFSAGPNGGNIIAVRAAGDFDAPLPADLAVRFPNIEIVDLRGAQRLASFNPVRAARLSSEKLKLIAPLLDIPHDKMPSLRQEEEKRQQTRLGSTLGAAIGVLLAVSSLSVYALQSRNRAFRALEDSMFSAGSMALSAANAMDDANAKQALSYIVTRGCDLVDKFWREALAEPQIEEIVMCRLRRALQHEKLEEPELAAARIKEAIDLAAKRHLQRSRIEAALALVSARQAAGEFYLRSKDEAAAAAEFGRLLHDARRLSTAHIDQKGLVRAEGEALGQLGDIEKASGRFREAAMKYDEAAVAVSKALALELRDNLGGNPPDWPQLAWVIRLQDLAGHQFLELGQIDEAVERFRRALAARELIKTSTIPVEIEQIMAMEFATIMKVEHGRANFKAANEAREGALLRLAQIAATPGASDDVKQKAAALKTVIDEFGRSTTK
jgi:tetratricopeptide (TPR) repeat protein